MASRQPRRKLEHHRVIHGSWPRRRDSGPKNDNHRDSPGKYVGLLAIISAAYQSCLRQHNSRKPKLDIDGLSGQ